MKGKHIFLGDSTKDDVQGLFKPLATVIIIFLVFAALKATSAVVVPIVFAVFVVLILNPLLAKLDSLHFPLWCTTLLGMTLFIAFLAAAGWLMFITIQKLIVGLPPYASRISIFDNMLTDKLRPFINIPIGQTILSKLDVDWVNILLTSLTNISSQFANIIANVLLVAVFTLFILLERTTFIPKLIDAASKDQSKRVKVISERITKQISRYLVIKVIISAATGLLFFITAEAVGLDFALLWGIMAFVLNFIPTIGSLISTIAIILMAVLQFAPNWIPIFYVAVLSIAIQTVLGNIIDPRLQGIQLGLSPLMLLVSLSLWGFIWGIPGMFLAVPITSGIQVVCINIPSLRPFAIILGSGKPYKRRQKEESWLRRSAKRSYGKGQKTSSEDLEKQADEKAKNSLNQDDFVLPEIFPGNEDK
ncbi:MAG: AI-2E family transporter [Spirochaetia bacterium]|jgi:predicted PurR-regulated permease PerM|nr:AI-2E family transporter [Spirochaetia bacterium]